LNEETRDISTVSFQLGGESFHKLARLKESPRYLWSHFNVWLLNPQLGRWVADQRKELKWYMNIYGESLHLADETIKARVRKLNEIQFNWEKASKRG
jgi:hypothetical protein